VGGRALIVFAALLASVAHAADVEGEVHLSSAPDGGTAPQIVVYLTGFTQPPPAATPTVAQKDKTFLPPLTVIVAGQSVRFSNDDPLVHNVFSTSKARPFDLGKPGPGEAREVPFPTPGVVDVYCNIHEQMSATILVLPNRAFTVLQGGGHFLLHDVPEGTWSLFAWGPRVNPFQATVTVGAKGSAKVQVELTPRAFQASHLDKFGRPYRERSYPP
jgi:plastocyanin